MAVRDIEAKTRQIASRDIRQGQEIQAAQEAQNQLLAIQAERKQNLATARVMAGQEAQQAGLLAQTASIAADSSPSVVQAPINPATQQILSQYGVGQPNVNKVQRSTQQITKQNIVVNNYNTTTTTTTNNNNINSGGPTQGRGIVINPNNNPNSLKVWINNWSARQNELAAKRDAEYLKRDSALERSSNKMMRRIEESTRTVATALDPRRMNNSFSEQLKGVLLMVGFGLLIKKFPVIMDKVISIESRFKNYFGIGLKDGEESGIRKDMKFLSDQLKDRFNLLLEDRKKALDSLGGPDWKIGAGIGSNLKSFANYLKDALGVLVGGTGERAKQIEEEIQTGVSEAAINKAANNNATIGLKSEHLKTDEKGNVSLKAGSIASIEAATTATSLLNSALDGGSNEKVDVESIINILKLLEKAVRENKEVVLPKDFIEALENIGVKIDKTKLTTEGGQYYYNQKTNQRVFIRDSESNSILSSGFEPYAAKTTVYTLNPDQFKAITDAFCDKAGINKDNFSFINMSEEEIAASNALIGNVRKDAVKNQTSGEKMREFGRKLGVVAKNSGKAVLKSGLATAINPFIGTIVSGAIINKEGKKLQEGLTSAESTSKTSLDDSFTALDENRQAAANYSAEVAKKNQEAKEYFGIGNQSVVELDENEGNDEDSNPEVEPTEWNSEASLNALERNASDESQGYCAGAVRQALNAGGLFPAKGNAWTYNNGKLEKIGFSRIDNPKDGKPYQKGDILVTERNNSHIYGHIAMFNGKKWVSDFKQNNPDGIIYNVDPPTSHLYRYAGIPSGIGGDYINPSMISYVKPTSHRIVPSASYKTNTDNWSKAEKGGDGSESKNYSELLVELKSISALLEQNVMMTASTADEVQKNTKAVISVGRSSNIPVTSNARSLS